MSETEANKSARKFLSDREWSMGNGQCPDCFGVHMGWLGHPVHPDSSSIGHKSHCKRASAMLDLGMNPVMKENKAVANDE